MTTDQYDARLFELDALKTLAAAYEQEHDWDADEDPSATYELIVEVRHIYAKLVAQLGERPADPPPVPADPSIPF